MSEQQQAAASGKRKRTIEQWAYDKLGNKWAGNTVPPMDNRRYKYDICDNRDYKVFSYRDDGSTVWIGTGDEWHHHLPLKTFRRVALWTLWHWAWTDWFGMRTKVWYWLLFRRVNKHKSILRERP